MNDDIVNTDEDDNDGIIATILSNSCKASNLRPQESNIARFYHQLAMTTPRKPVVLSLVSEYDDNYIPIALTPKLLSELFDAKPLSELFDANTIDLTFDELLKSVKMCMMHSP